MRFPAPCHVVTCLPCGYREAIRPDCAYPPRCPNCGGHQVEHYNTEINDKAEWRAVFRPGLSVRVKRPRIVIGAPA